MPPNHHLPDILCCLQLVRKLEAGVDRPLRHQPEDGGLLNLNLNLPQIR